MKKSLFFCIISFLFICCAIYILTGKNHDIYKNNQWENFENVGDFGDFDKIENIIIPNQAEEIAELSEIWKPTFQDANFVISEQNENMIFEVPILMFHYIQDIPSNTTDQLWYKLSYSPQKLETLLLFFKENDIEMLTFWDLKSIIEGKKELPDKSVILTFDDWHLDHYTNAFPVLKKHGAKAVFFIISNKPDNDPKFANWDQIREIAENWFEIWSHSVSHSSMSALSRQNVLYELEESKKKIQEEIGLPVISFCYPSWKYSNTVLNLIKDYYIFARTTHNGTKLKVNRRFELPTIRINPTTKTGDLNHFWGIE